ncbi:MAG: lipopolysaccharide kinase InaA family protein [Verrucomicrobiia bacterium]
MLTATEGRPQVLQRLGLDSLAAIKGYHPASVVKDHDHRRDVSRIEDRSAGLDAPLTLYLKRLWRVPKKDGLKSFFRFGRVRSAARQELLNCRALQAAGIPIAEVVATGEELGPFWERFSFIVTAAARGQTVEDFLRLTRGKDNAFRRATLHQLALLVRRMHDLGFFPPDLFTRHIFVESPGPAARFCLIDIARLTVSPNAPDRLRARDLAALNVTAPLADVTHSERVRFLLAYDPNGRRLIPRIRRRSLHLLKRRKFQPFFMKPKTPSADNVVPHHVGESYLQTASRFDRSAAASLYATRHGGNARDCREQKCIERALEGVPRSARVLDLPSGTGRLLPMLHRRGYRIVEADYSPHMLDQARLLWKEYLSSTPAAGSAEIAFEVQDVMKTTYAGQWFDATICSRLFHHFSESSTRIAALKELRRITRGPIVLSFFNADTIDARFKRLVNALRGRPLKARIPIPLAVFAEDVKAAGLRIDAKFPTRGSISPQTYVRLITT